MLLVLGFDVYPQPARRTIAQVAGQGIDLTKLHEETWNGVPVHVVGADTRFLDHRRLSPGWVARFALYVDGNDVFSERYSDIRVNPKLDPAIFDPRQFARRHWEK